MKIKISDLNPKYITVAWCDMQTDDYHDNFTENIEDADVEAIVTIESPQVLWEYLQDSFMNPLSMWYWIIVNGKCICSGACDPATDPDIIADYFGDKINYD